MATPRKNPVLWPDKRHTENVKKNKEQQKVTVKPVASASAFLDDNSGIQTSCYTAVTYTVCVTLRLFTDTIAHIR